MPDLEELSELCSTVLNEAGPTAAAPAPEIPDHVAVFVRKLGETMNDYVGLFVKAAASVRPDASDTIVRHAVDLYEDVRDDVIRSVERFAGAAETVRVPDTERADRIKPARDTEWRLSPEDVRKLRSLGLDPDPSQWFPGRYVKGKTDRWVPLDFYMGGSNVAKQAGLQSPSDGTNNGPGVWRSGTGTEDPTKAREDLWNRMKVSHPDRVLEITGNPTPPPSVVRDEDDAVGHKYSTDTMIGHSRWKTVRGNPEAGLDKIRQNRINAVDGGWSWVPQPERHGGYWWQNFDLDSSEYEKYVRDDMFAEMKKMFPELHERFFEFYDFLKKTNSAALGDKKSKNSITAPESVMEIVDRSIDLRELVNKTEASLPPMADDEFPDPDDPVTLEQDPTGAPGTDKDYRHKQYIRYRRMMNRYRKEQDEENEAEANAKNRTMELDGTTDPGEMISPHNMDPNRDYNMKYAYVPNEAEKEAARRAAEAREERKKQVEADKQEWMDRIEKAKQSPNRPKWYRDPKAPNVPPRSTYP